MPRMLQLVSGPASLACRPGVLVLVMPPMLSRLPLGKATSSTSPEPYARGLKVLTSPVAGSYAISSLSRAPSAPRPPAMYRTPPEAAQAASARAADGSRGMGRTQNEQVRAVLQSRDVGVKRCKVRIAVHGLCTWWATVVGRQHG